jgi:N-acetylmuramoyl-L-alanine amidase
MVRAVVRIVMVTGLALLALIALEMGILSPVSASSSPPPVWEGQEEVGSVCFWSEQGPVCVERFFEVDAAGLGPESLLVVLLQGPTPEERAQGIWSAVPEETTLRDLDVRSDGTVLVRLAVPLEALRVLDHDTFETIVYQIGRTLEPLAWRDLRVHTWDPITGEFVPLASFLPEIPTPRKETVVSGEETPVLSAASGGQPSVYGQGQQQGALSDKTVYVSAGHGWQWNGYAWRTQRPPYPNSPYEGPIIEDHNNAEAVNQYLLQYLWNAGAQVWPVRERDMNGVEVVVDNDVPGQDAGYDESGAWTTVSGTGYSGTDYRQATTVIDAPTATAVWTATLPADGEYAVYVWYRPGSDRAPDARYTVHHAGGETAVTVDQRHHGITWHYIGTYGFQGGEVAEITLDNLSSQAGQVVVADAVRFGGGTFSDLTGIQTSATDAPDKPWWEVAAYYYTQRMGMDQPPGDVTARPIYARWEHAGTGDDAVYVSWHTNGVSGYQWSSHGTLSIIHNGEGNPITPGSEALRDAIHAELVQDIQAGWDSDWPGYKRSMNLGELRELWDSNDPSASIPGALIEIAYHDHPDDADALKDPRFNMLAARAMYQGIVKYFEQRDGIDLTELPEPPTHLAVQNVGGGQVQVSWMSPLTDAVDLVGDPATGYRVYTSSDGLGWSNGVPAATTVYTLTGLSSEQLLFVRVTATNEGGESFPTETLAVRVGDEAEVLLVNGFDRLNRTMVVSETDPVEGHNMRMFVDQMNRYDYTVQHGEVISYPFDSAGNESVRDGLVDLGDYVLVDWILGEESASDETLDAVERVLLAEFLGNGGALFLSGTEIGWHLDYLEADPDFYNDVLRADYVGDDAGSYEVASAPGSIFEGLEPFSFDAAGMFDADFPDVVKPVNGSTAALTYATGVTAAIQYADGCERLVYFGFPFETIQPDQRPGVMERMLGFLDECLSLPINTNIVVPTYGSAHNTTSPFMGTADAGEMVVLERVEVQVQRTGGSYWAGGEWVTEPAWLTATGTLVWSYELPALSDADYYLRARARTTDGTADPSPAEVVFTYDTISPTHTALITPTRGVTLTGGVLVFAWEAVAPDGGSDLAYVFQLDGQPYTTAQPIYTTTLAAEGLHTWGVQVFDAAGNRSGWVTDTFYIGRYSCWLPLVMRNFENSEDGGGDDECTDVLGNGSFESDESWVLNRLATYDTMNVHTGARSVRVGIPPGEPGNYAYSSVAQTVALPAGSEATLQLWVYPLGEGDDTDDWHYVSLRDQLDVYHVLDQWHSEAGVWEQREYDLSAFLGQTVVLYVGTRNDGDDDTAAMYVDDVTLEVCP